MDEEIPRQALENSGLTPDLYRRYHRELSLGKVSDDLNAEILEYALDRDKAYLPNLSGYTFLTPEKRDELNAKYAVPPDSR